MSYNMYTYTLNNVQRSLGVEGGPILDLGPELPQVRILLRLPPALGAAVLEPDLDLATKTTCLPRPRGEGKGGEGHLGGAEAEAAGEAEALEARGVGEHREAPLQRRPLQLRQHRPTRRRRRLLRLQKPPLFSDVS